MDVRISHIEKLLTEVKALLAGGTIETGGVTVNTTTVENLIQGNGGIIEVLENVLNAIPNIASLATNASISQVRDRLPGFSIPPFDTIQNTYVGSTNNLSTVVYRNGGVNGSIVATLTFSYVGGTPSADDAKISAIVRS